MQDSGKINTFFQISFACYRYDKMFIIVPYMIYILSYIIIYDIISCMTRYSLYVIISFQRKSTKNSLGKTTYLGSMTI